MKYFKYIKSNFPIVLLLILLLSACEKKELYLEKSDRKDLALVYVSRSDTRQSIPFHSSKDSTIIFDFGANLADLGYANADIQVKFAYDPKALDSLNKIRTIEEKPFYQKLPDAAYKLSTTTVTIKSGTLNSNLIQMTCNFKNLVDSIDYLLPLTIVEVSNGYKLNNKLKTIFIKPEKIDAQ